MISTHRMRMACISLAALGCVLRPLPVLAAQTNGLGAVRRKYDTGVALVERDTLSSYSNALAGMAAAARNAGDFEQWTMLTRERESIAAMPVVPTGAARESLSQRVSGYATVLTKLDAEKAARIYKLQSAYVAKLDELLKQLMRAEKTTDAQAVNDEKQKISTLMASYHPPAPAATHAVVPAPPVMPAQPPHLGNSTAGKELVIDLGDHVTIAFALIQPGTFTMGNSPSTEPFAHRVTLTKPYYIGKYEVTQQQWERVMGTNPSTFRGPNNPVDNVSWEEARLFTEKLSALKPGQRFALPTEAQWEYACRAGRTSEDESRLLDSAWLKANSGDTTHPVGRKKPNAWGLYDMQGNVSEWCQDWKASHADEETDPAGPRHGTCRIRRGGSWNNGPDGCRSYARNNRGPTTEGDFTLGLRVVMLPDE